MSDPITKEWVPMQETHPTPRRVLKEIAELAYEEYCNQGHGSQSFDRLHERGGFGTSEIITLLAGLIERERGG